MRVASPHSDSVTSPAVLSTRTPGQPLVLLEERRVLLDDLQRHPVDVLVQLQVDLLRLLQLLHQLPKTNKRTTHHYYM